MKLVDLQIGDLIVGTILCHSFAWYDVFAVLIEKNEQANYYNFYCPKWNEWVHSHELVLDQYRENPELKVLSK
mgnify:CR=1 FL=1